MVQGAEKARFDAWDPSLAKAPSARFALEERHAGDGEGGVAALVALVAAGAGQGLLHVVAGNDAEGAGDAARQLHVLDASRRLGADEVVVVGLAADEDRK